MMSVMLMLGTGGSFWVLMRVMSKCSRLYRRFLWGENRGNERDMSRREWMGMMSNNGV
jgi:hypothetical protein